MKIVVSIKTKTEERKMTAFLDSMKIAYQSSNEFDDNSYKEFLKDYNSEIETAVNEIDNNSYISHREVKKILAERRKSNG